MMPPGSHRLSGGTMVGVSTAPVELEPAVDEPKAEFEVLPDLPWVTIVWNDPINLMSYVTFVFQDYFGYDRAKSERLMLQVHEDGRATVSSGSREEMERDVAAMHGYGLWATMQKDK
jgi:ATP-dependent Clp protease adaptor protein ClpS